MAKSGQIILQDWLKRYTECPKWIRLDLTGNLLRHYAPRTNRPDAETSVSQQALQDAISTSISDPLIKNVTATLQAGYVLVSGERQRLKDASKTDTLTFRLDLSASNGKLTASISNAQIDGKPVEQNRLENWNQVIANRLSKLGQKHPNSTLQSMSITTDRVTITWNVKR